MMIGQLLPKRPAVPYETANQLMTKKTISKMIDTVYRGCGQKETVIFCDRIMDLGFKHAARAGISFGKDDMVIPASKAKIVEAARKQVEEFEQQYNDGLITQGEKYNKVVDAWAKCGDKVAEEMMKGIASVQFDKETGRQKPINSVYMMSHSGARGSPAQMKQLAGMRGLMARPDGSIIETPITANFKEGLNVLEYFNSTHGARKGLADTALKTANSGYLTRRLVDVAQDAIIISLDCGTDRGLTMEPIVDAGQIVATLGQRILGRTAAEDITDPVSGKVLVAKGWLITEKDVDAVEAARIQSVKIRSPLTCDLRQGCCAACYGRDLARGTPVNIGEAVGVIAAQSIGEPGTQLTMRTFHIGGTAQVVDTSFLEAGAEGRIEIRNRHVAKVEGGLVAMGRNVAIAILDNEGKERTSHRVTYGAKLKVDDGDEVKRGQRIAEWDPYTRPILAEVDGTVSFEGLLDGTSVSETTDEATGFTKRVVIDWRTSQRGAELRPALAILHGDKVAKVERGGDARYLLSVDAVIAVEPGEKVAPGDVLARIPLESAKTKDITGGLPRVAELFEARRPKDHAIIAEIDGTIRFGRDYKNKRRIIIDPEDKTAEPVEYLIPKGKPFHLQEGDAIEKGEYILDGNPAPHDILAIKGVEELARYPRQRDPGGLPAAGRADQRQAHRGDRSPDAAEGRDHRSGRFRHAQGRAARPAGLRRAQRPAPLGGQEADRVGPRPARHHQGVAADPQLRLGRLLPGNHPRPHRGGGFRQGRPAGRPQGERHCRPADPGGHGCRHRDGQADRRQARRPHPRRASPAGRNGGDFPPPSRRPAEPAE